MVDDLSKGTLFVLVILTLLISLLGTWTVLSQVPSGEVAVVVNGAPSDSGQVNLKILPPPETYTDSATGQVALMIEKR